MAALFAGEFPSGITGTLPGALNNEAFAATPSVAGSSSGSMADTNFTTAADVVFYPSEPEIVATASVTTMAGAASTIVTLPDGSVMTLVGVAAAGPVLFAP